MSAAEYGRRYTVCAISRIVTDRAQSSRTAARPCAKTSSPGSHPKAPEATWASLALTSRAARAAEDPPTTRLRPVELPNPYGQLAVSPCTTDTVSTDTPNSSATTWAMPVSLPPPGDVTPVRTVTLP